MTEKLRWGVKFAIYESKEFVLTQNDEDRSSVWMLFSSNYYGTINDAKSLGFLSSNQTYYLPITPDDLESAYSVENYCEYKGDILECYYEDEKQQFSFDMRGASKELCEKFGLAYEYERWCISRGYEDSQMFFEVPDSEILNVWEIHKPIDGFPFKGPEKVWVKRDGVWLR